MARGMSKAAKAEAYDALAERSDLMQTLLCDIGRDVQPDAVVQVDEADGDESVRVIAKLYRSAGAPGGIVLLRAYTRYADGSPDSSSDIHIVRLDALHALAGGEQYWRSTWGRAVYAAALQLKDARARVYAERG